MAGDSQMRVVQGGRGEWISLWECRSGYPHKGGWDGVGGMERGFLENILSQNKHSLIKTRLIKKNKKINYLNFEKKNY